MQVQLKRQIRRNFDFRFNYWVIYSDDQSTKGNDCTYYNERLCYRHKFCTNCI